MKLNSETANAAARFALLVGVFAAVIYYNEVLVTRSREASRQSHQKFIEHYQCLVNENRDMKAKVRELEEELDLRRRTIHLAGHDRPIVLSKEAYKRYKANGGE